MVPNYAELEKNICYVIKEQHIKLGYSADSVSGSWLYYPLGALNHMLGTSCGIPEMEQVLEGFFDFAEARLGKGSVTHKGERFCLRMDAKASEYVHGNVPDEPFLVELVEALATHGTTMDDIVAVFRKYSDNVHVEEADSDEFDMLVYFEDGQPDPFVYCLADEMGHVTYHRMMKQELQERLKQ